MLYYGGKKVLYEVKDIDVILYEALLNYANLVYCQRCKRATEDISVKEFIYEREPER